MMKNVYMRLLLICCVLFYLIPGANMGSESLEDVPLVSEEADEEQSSEDTSTGGEKRFRTADRSYGSIDLSELSIEGKQYLGLTDDVKPILRNVDADLIIVEFLSVYCPSCQMQAPVFNQLHFEVQKDSSLKARAKMMGIGVGNNGREVDYFREIKGIEFPVLPDPKFEIYERLVDSMRTPYTIMLRRDKDGELILVDSHMGLVESYEPYLDEVRLVMQYDENMIKLKQAEALAGKAVRRTELMVSGKELMEKVQESMIRASDDQNIDVILKPIPLRVTPENPETPEVYEGRSENEKYFAVVVNRESVCDICHAIQFIYVFDENGNIADFEPIHLTKYGNKKWSEKDIAEMRQRIVGRSILHPVNFDFDSEVDAVSSATITSAVIFQSLTKSREIFRFVIK